MISSNLNQGDKLSDIEIHSERAIVIGCDIKMRRIEKI